MKVEDDEGIAVDYGRLYNIDVLAMRGRGVQNTSIGNYCPPEP